MLQHVSDHKVSIIRKLHAVLSYDYINGSIVSVDMDVVDVTAAYLPVLRVCSARSREALLDSTVHTRNTHTHHRQICCHNTDYVHANRHDRTINVILSKHCINLPDDGSLVVRNML